MGLWPWWIGAPALAAIALLFWILQRRPFGVSGSFTHLVTPRSLDANNGDALSRDPEALKAALMAATVEAFGAEAVASSQGEARAGKPAGMDTWLRPSPPWAAHLMFLVAMGVGGLLAGQLSGLWEIRLDMGPRYTQLIGSSWTANLVLLLGGLLTGFGTRMCGGCTSGHGLSGCGRLQPGSLVATAAFFGTGIVVSFVLAWIGG